MIVTLALRSTAVLIGALAAGIAYAAAADETTPSWKLCAASASIVSGVLHVPVDEMRSASAREGRYLTATVDVRETLKGTRSDSVVVSFYSEDAPYAPTLATLIALNGKVAMVFLVAGDTPKPGTLYFAQAPDAVRTAAAPKLHDVRAEVLRQEQVLRHWVPHPEWPHETDVKALIAQTLVPKTENQAFARLEALGTDAVPAIADLMDDRRRLGIPQITLRNPPKFFEATRHYNPELVVDAMAAILNQITGASFGEVESGGSEEQRRLAVNGWRIYAEQLRKKQH